MCLKVFAKRIAPFVVTFAVGLFIASFFVTIAMPNFRFGGRHRRQQQEINRLQLENEQLRGNDCRLKRLQAELDRINAENDVRVEYSFDVPPPPPAPPAPPKAPMAPTSR